MKTHSFEFFGGQALDIGSVFGEALEGYHHIHSDAVHIFVAESVKLRTGSSMMNVVVVSTCGASKYRVDIVVGGGSKGVVVPLDFGSESDELGRLMGAIRNLCKAERIVPFEPGDSYYNT